MYEKTTCWLQRLKSIITSACWQKFVQFLTDGSILLRTPYVIWFNGKFFTIVGMVDCPFSSDISAELRKIVNCIYDSKRSHNVGNSKWNSGATVSIKFWSNPEQHVARYFAKDRTANGEGVRLSSHKGKWTVYSQTRLKDCFGQNYVHLCGNSFGFVTNKFTAIIIWKSAFNNVSRDLKEYCTIIKFLLIA